jgi:hypothetical protein
MTHDIVAETGQGTALVPTVGNRSPTLGRLLRQTVELALDVADEIADRVQGILARR